MFIGKGLECVRANRSALTHSHWGINAATLNEIKNVFFNTAFHRQDIVPYPGSRSGRRGDTRNRETWQMGHRIPRDFAKTKIFSS